jgi:hypothetical protein
LFGYLICSTVKITEGIAGIGGEVPITAFAAGYAVI